MRALEVSGAIGIVLPAWGWRAVFFVGIIPAPNAYSPTRNPVPQLS